MTSGEQGASLVVALVLLTALTLLGLSSMKRTTLGLSIAGSERLRADTYQIADSAAHATLRQFDAVSLATSTSDVVVVPSGTDSRWDVAARVRGEGLFPLPGNSLGSFGAQRYAVEVEAVHTGGSARRTIVVRASRRIPVGL